MHSLARGLQQRAADSQIRVALFAAGLYVLLRLLPVDAIVLRGAGDASTSLVAQLVGALVLAVVFAVGLYRRHFLPALVLFCLSAIGFGYSWFLSKQWIPPLGLIGILIGLGLFQGVRGTGFYRRGPTIAP